MFSTLMAGLIRNAGQHVTFKIPKNLEEAVLVALATFDVEAQKRRNETSYANSESTEVAGRKYAEGHQPNSGKQTAESALISHAHWKLAS
jgi:hypothetical protein